MAKMINLDRVNGYPVIFKNTLSEELENSVILCAKELVEGEHEAYKVEKATDKSEGLIIVHASVPMQYDERLTEADFKLKVGEFGRGFVLEPNDVITVAESLATAVVVVGDKLGLSATDGGKLAKGGDMFTVIAKENWNGQPSLVLRKH